MKKLLAFCLILITILSGCANPPFESAVGDFSFCPPEGYAIEDISDLNCMLVRESDMAAVGGVELTPLKQKALTSRRDNSIMAYLQEQFHKTNNVEFLLQRWNEGNPMVTVHLRKYADNNTQTMYSHIFFQKDGWVYHLWLDESIAGEAAADAFLKALR